MRLWLKLNSIDVVIMDVVCLTGWFGNIKRNESFKLRHKDDYNDWLCNRKNGCRSNETGGFDYIVKPFENDELVKMVKAAIAEGKSLDALNNA